MPREEVARTFSVSVPTIKRWLKRRRESGDVEPKPIPGRPGVKRAALKEWLPSHLENNADLTLEEHREAFEEAHSGVMRVSRATVGRSEEHTSELQSRQYLVCRLLLEKKNN